MKNFRYIDIADKIEQLINNNTHPAGEKLPSLRIISHQYNVSIGTAIKAFSLLEDKGLIAAREKSGFVALRKSGFRTELPESPHNKPAVKDVRVSKIFSMIPPDDDVHAAKYISFFNATLDTTMTPFNAIRRSIQNASRDLSGRHLQYESSSGSTL
ncbi:MAG TPA: GntR family transcriptional regulator, partial [Chitinophaga sp.]|uniref:GntR family transcriptional regulator n=1 Tax=Chitinophaga sp. TaxID=1869181 RepID=UPI002C64D95C